MPRALPLKPEVKDAYHAWFCGQVQGLLLRMAAEEIATATESEPPRTTIEPLIGPDGENYQAAVLVTRPDGEYVVAVHKL